MPKTIQNIQLVEGVFSPVEAANVLLSLINDKIKFHNVQMLGLQELEADKANRSQERIKALENNKHLVRDLVLKARDEGYGLQIDGNIQIRLIPLTEN